MAYPLFPTKVVNVTAVTTELMFSPLCLFSTKSHSLIWKVPAGRFPRLHSYR